MTHALKDFIGKFMAYYQVGLTIHSKHKQLHIKHLREVFIICRMFGISLNPEKCLFAVLEGRLLGHIMSNKRIYIDPKII